VDSDMTAQHERGGEVIIGNNDNVHEVAINQELMQKIRVLTFQVNYLKNT
jgi:hypothetical protein